MTIVASPNPSTIQPRKSRWPGWGLISIGLVGGAYLLCRALAESLWFRELGFLEVLWQRWLIQAGLWALGLVGGLVFLGFNSGLAHRLRQQTPTTSERALGLQGLLPLSLSLAILTLALVQHTVVVAVSFNSQAQETLAINPLLPQFDWSTLIQIGWGWCQNPLYLLIVLGAVVGCLWHPFWGYRLVAVLQSLGLAWLGRNHWAILLQAWQRTNFHQNDPLFQNDLGFYIFTLPFWEWLRFASTALMISALAGVTLIYLLAGDSLSLGRFTGFNRPQRQHIQALAGGFCFCLALSFWLERYKLLYSARGVTFGASYTDIHVTLPLLTIFAGFTLVVGFLLLWSAWRRGGKGQIRLAPASPWLLRTVTGYACLIFIIGQIIPDLVQATIVQPNELQRERPYLQRSIDFTRQAFRLDEVYAEPFQPENNLTAPAIAENAPTIRNIRLWDTRPLLETNRQLQQLRSYYRFPDAFIDRYRLSPYSSEPKPAANPSAEVRQVLTAARELDYAAVPSQAQSWVNQHLVFTHGYGFTMSPVNVAGEGGLPKYFVKDIVSASPGNLQTAGPAIASSIPIGFPRIYYGQITDTYVLAPSHVLELDYPTGNDNAYNHYAGQGGVPLGQLWQRLVMAVYFQDWQLLLTPNIHAKTKVLFRRNIAERVRTLAPFLRFDSQPYLVVADTRPESVRSAEMPDKSEPNFLYWVIDAYTVSRYYPYADPGQEPFNYIRNSVKVVVDAYHGSVQFFVMDAADPLIQTWQKIFPTLFKPITAMPAQLAAHIRYPVDLFQAQSQKLLRYHMTDAVVFYSQEDQWQIPQEIYGTEPQAVKPYYLIMRLPSGQVEEFILLYPFTPLNRPNLVAWLAARSDQEHYGKLLLYTFPKQELVFGPEQVEARINQDPTISQQISLWNRQGSRSLQGNLLIIPIERSLLYVEPLYLEASQNSLPILARVILMFNEQIVMAETLEQGLEKLFPGYSRYVNPDALTTTLDQ